MKPLVGFFTFFLLFFAAGASSAYSPDLHVSDNVVNEVENAFNDWMQRNKPPEDSDFAKLYSALQDLRLIPADLAYTAYTTLSDGSIGGGGIHLQQTLNFDRERLLLEVMLDKAVLTFIFQDRPDHKNSGGSSAKQYSLKTVILGPNADIYATGSLPVTIPDKIRDVFQDHINLWLDEDPEAFEKQYPQMPEKIAKSLGEGLEDIEFWGSNFSLPEGVWPSPYLLILGGPALREWNGVFQIRASRAGERRESLLLFLVATDDGYQISAAEFELTEKRILYSTGD